MSHKIRFLENPYDLETCFESLNIASKGNKELIYLDQLLARIRLDPTVDITELNYTILSELDLLKFEKIE